MIVNLASIVPFFGPYIVLLVWGGFSVNLYTLKRFFSFHFLLPFLVLALVLGHLLLLHFFGSSSNVSSHIRGSFFKLFFVKDLLSWLFWLFLYCFLSHIEINLLGDVENYLIAAPTKTPLHIKPEWYFLFAYAILRCIPNKTARVLALVASVTIFCSFSLNKSTKFLSFLSCFILLTIARAMPVEQPYINVAQVLSAGFFGLFL